MTASDLLLLSVAVGALWLGWYVLHLGRAERSRRREHRRQEFLASRRADRDLASYLTRKEMR